MDEIAEDTSGEKLLTEDDILARHRKEKKALQAEITRLKHSVPKGDKKKKKEITVQIAKLEAELDSKHNSELKEWNDAVANGVSKITESLDGLATDDSVSEKAKKPSKTQRRRDKKSQEAREREERIRQGEIDNRYGKRNVEAEKLKELLGKRNLTVYEVPSDGNCLYTALVDQLQRQGIQSSMESLRRQTALHMKSNQDDFIVFLTKPDTGEAFTEEEFAKYCDDVETTASWGGQLELRALSNTLKQPIEVIQADGPSIIIGEDQPGTPLILSYHRHIYGLGEHYNSVIPKNDEEEVDLQSVK